MVIRKVVKMLYFAKLADYPSRIVLFKKLALRFYTTKVQYLTESFVRFYFTVFRLVSKAALGR